MNLDIIIPLFNEEKKIKKFVLKYIILKKKYRNII